MDCQKTWHWGGFHERTNFETETFNTQRGVIRKEAFFRSVQCKSKRCKMEYIGQKGRQLKSRIKEYKADSKIRFLENVGQKDNTRISLKFLIWKTNTQQLHESGKQYYSFIEISKSGKRGYLKLEGPKICSMQYNELNQLEPITTSIPSTRPTFKAPKAPL